MEVFNNKGQSIVVFVLVLPLIMLFVAYVYDISKVNYEKKKMKNIAELTEDNFDSACEIVSENDKDIECNVTGNKLTLKKEIKSIFGKIIGNEIYKISVTVNIYNPRFLVFISFFIAASSLSCISKIE